MYSQSHHSPTLKIKQDSLLRVRATETPTSVIHYIQSLNLRTCNLDQIITRMWKEEVVCGAHTRKEDIVGLLTSSFRSLQQPASTGYVHFVMSATLPFVNYIIKSYPINMHKIVLTSSAMWLFDAIKNVIPTVPEKYGSQC